MQKIFEIEQGVPEICPWGQVSPGASVWGANVAQSLHPSWTCHMTDQALDYLLWTMESSRVQSPPKGS